MNVDDILRDLHASLAKNLLEKVKDPECSPQAMAVAVKFLKDNGIECLPQNSKDMTGLSQLLGKPFEGEGDTQLQ